MIALPFGWVIFNLISTLAFVVLAFFALSHG